MIEIPITSIELDRIYNQMQKRDMKSFALCSAEAQEGTSSITLALAKRAASSGERVLLIDFNIIHPEITTQFEAPFNDYNRLEDTLTKNIMQTPIPNLALLSAPCHSKHLMQIRNAEELKKQITKLSQYYDIILVDTSPINSSLSTIIPGEVVTACVNASVLVVLAGRTPENKVIDAITKIDKVGANLLGTILNDQFYPKLADELSRETERFDKVAPGLMAKLREKFKKSAFLNLDL